MAKVKCFYDKSQAIPIVATPGFFAYPIEVEANTLKQMESLRELLKDIEEANRTAGFPRDAQAVATAIEESIGKIMKVQKRRPKNVNEPDSE
jgi:hypothetical protein